MDQKAELRDRVESKRKEIESKLYAARADTRRTAQEQVDRLERKLRELDETLKDGWDRLTDDLAARLNRWLSN